MKKFILVTLVVAGIASSIGWWQQSFHGTTIGKGVVLMTPDADGSNGQVIVTDGAGTLSFDDAAGSSEWTETAGVLSPTTATDVVLIEAGNVAHVPMTIKGEASHTGDLLQIWDEDSGNQVVTVDDDGKVGLGVNAPGANLHIDGSASDTVLMKFSNERTGDGTSAIEFDRASISVENGFWWKTGGAAKFFVGQNNQASENIIFWNEIASGYALYVDGPTNQVGINNGSPAAQLDVEVNGASVVGMIIEADAGQTADLLQINDSVGTNLVSVDDAGGVDIDQGEDGNGLRIQGYDDRTDRWMHFYISSAGASVMDASYPIFCDSGMFVGSDTTFGFGDSHQWDMQYQSSGDELVITDDNQTNNILRIIDEGTTATMVFAGTIATVPGGDDTLADNGTIDVTGHRIIRVIGTSGDALLDSTTAIADGTTDGQEIIIQGTHNTETVSIPDAANTALASDATATLGQGDMIFLIWDSGDSVWYEVSRNTSN